MQRSRLHVRASRIAAGFGGIQVGIGVGEERWGVLELVLDCLRSQVGRLKDFRTGGIIIYLYGGGRFQK